MFMSKSLRARLLAGVSILVLLLAAFGPAAVLAASKTDDQAINQGVTVSYQEVEGEQESPATEGGLAGVGITLFLLAFVFLLLAVVAVIGAVSLGIIGLGAWFAQDND
jgi:hypothetical protein